MRRRRGHGEQADARPRTPANHPKVALDTINFSNWPLYIDRKVIGDFETRFDVELHYVEDINDNNEFFGKVRQQLEAGRADRP